MIVGTEFRVSNEKMMKPLLGKLVEVPIEGEKVPVLARIVHVDEDGTVLRSVPLTTRD